MAAAAAPPDEAIVYNAQLSTGRWELSSFTTGPKARPGHIRRGFLDTPQGQVHYRYAGLEHKDNGNLPILFFHMNPRSSDEYRELMAIYGKTRLVLAGDMLGFGDSDRPSPDDMPTVEDYASHGKLLLDEFGVQKAVAYGGHTGAFVACELAVREPDTIERLVLANAPWFGENEEGKAFHGKEQLWMRYKRGWHIQADGSHLMDRWNKRKHYVGSASINHRWVLDDLKCFGYPLYAMHAVHNYVDGCHERMRLVQSKVCLLWGDLDVQEFERLGLARCVDNEKIESCFPGAVIKRCASGTICMCNQVPWEIFHALEAWLAGEEDGPSAADVVRVPDDNGAAAAQPPAAKKAKRC